MLEILFSLDGSLDIILGFYIDQVFQAVAFRETICQTFTVLPYTPGEITGHTDVQRTIWPVCHDINPAAFHLVRIAVADGVRQSAVDHRVKPGDDGKKDAGLAGRAMYRTGQRSGNPNIPPRSS